MIARDDLCTRTAGVSPHATKLKNVIARPDVLEARTDTAPHLQVETISQWASDRNRCDYGILASAIPSRN